MIDTPLTGHIKVDINVATIVSDFLLVLLKLKESPLNGDQIAAFSEFREAVKAGPVQERKAITRTTEDGIVIANGTRMLLDRNLGVKFLRGTISGEMPEALQADFMVALVDAIATKGPKYGTGMHGKWCNGMFGFVDPLKAKDFLSGLTNAVTISRAKIDNNCMPLYFAEQPNMYITGGKKPWTGPKDHVKTKFSEEEIRNHEAKNRDS